MESRLPTGTVTFLMTDIEGSTRLWEEKPRGMAAAMRRHDELANQVVSTTSGIIIKSRGEGDSLFVVFPTGSQAIQAALSLLRAMESEPWPDGIKLKARASVHSGEALTAGQDYYGPTVNKCARLRSVGHGGQILISGATKALVGSELPDDLGLRFLGSYRLKDIEQPEEIWQTLAPGTPTDFPPLRTWADIPTNLASDLTTFVGRAAEIIEITSLFDRHRLVTLTGTGGGGKSRLAVEIARNLMPRFPDGVWLIELADLSDGDQVARAIQSSLKLPPACVAQGMSSVVLAIKDLSVLLILDNCEHLLEPVAEAAVALLRGAPEARILATSREPIGAKGEVVCRVPSLALPSKKFANLDALAGNESVALFVDRARSHAANFSLTQENADAVVDICRMVDGIPLALELAAARIRVLRPDELARRLEDRFRILTGTKGALPRHQTLRATIEWSCRMVTDLEREAFEQLSVFVGGWTLELAERTCGDPIDEFDLLDLLTALVDKSLVNFDAGDEGRYTYFESIRQFAREQLANRPDAETAALSRHAAAMARYGMDRVLKFRTTAEPEALQQLVRNLPNLEAALGWAKKQDDLSLMAQLALAIGSSHQRRGYPRDGVGPIEEVLSTGSRCMDLDPQVYARLLCERASLALDLLENEVAEPLATQAREIARTLEITELKIWADNLLGQVSMANQDFEKTRDHYNEALRLSEESQNWVEMARLRNNLGIVERRDPQGDKELAALHYRAALEIQRTQMHSRGEAETLNSLGVLEQSRGHLAEAAALYIEAGQIEILLEHVFGVAKTLSNYGEVLAELGENQKAVQPLGIAEQLFGQIRSPYREYTASTLAQAAALLGWSGTQLEEFRARCGRVELKDAVTSSLQAE